MLCAHLDTVGVAGMADPFSAHVEGTRLHGRGSYDMKGGLAAVMVAGANACSARLRRRRGRGRRRRRGVRLDRHRVGLKTWKADAAVLTEPTGLDGCIAHRGFVLVELRVHGRAAHGSQPCGSTDPPPPGTRAGIEELDNQLRTSTHSLLGRASVHASMIEGGQELSRPGAVHRRRRAADAARRVGRGRDRGAGRARAGRRCGRGRDPARSPAVRDQRRRGDRHARLERRRRGARCRAGDHRPPGLDGRGVPVRGGDPDGRVRPARDGGAAMEEWVELGDVALVADVLTSVAAEYCA